MIFLAQRRLDPTHQRKQWSATAESQQNGARKAVKKQRPLSALMSVKKKNHEKTINLPFPSTACEAILPCELKRTHSEKIQQNITAL